MLDLALSTYSGTWFQAGATIGHGLSKAPEMMIFKSRTNTNEVGWDIIS